MEEILNIMNYFFISIGVYPLSGGNLILVSLSSSRVVCLKR
ncbi:hypothetical protein Leryth_002308, partial [Lithospermum erythrorhizon]